jgi:hypothetical protein
MKTRTKWILGILTGVVILAALAAVGYFVFSHWAGMRGNLPWDDRGWRQQMPMHPYRGLPGMRSGIFSPLRFVGGGLLCLGVLALLVAGVYLLVRGLRRPQNMTTAASATPVAVPAAIVAPAPAAAPAPAVEHACPNCARQVQADWTHCPYCGAPLS